MSGNMFAPKKGKEPTKGQHQIDVGNRETLRFYAIMAGVSFLLKFAFSFPSIQLGLVFSLLVQTGAIAGMYHMVGGGIDLNLKAGFAEYLKDLIITTAICTGLSIFSSLFWLLWLWIPAFLIYKVWTGIVAPWIFAPAPEVEPEVADKKRRKMERKMARAGYR